MSIRKMFSHFSWSNIIWFTRGRELILNLTFLNFESQMDFLFTSKHKLFIRTLQIWTNWMIKRFTIPIKFVINIHYIFAELSFFIIWLYHFTGGNIMCVILAFIKDNIKYNVCMYLRFLAVNVQILKKKKNSKYVHDSQSLTDILWLVSHQFNILLVCRYIK